MNLTIAIPTFNRNEILEKNLSNLLPRLSGGCKVLVIDNCSDVPVQATLSNVIKNTQTIDVKIIRNEFNIGMTGNILKCFELCETPWLWVLGDDDFVHAGAVNKIQEDLKGHSDCNFISYAWDAPSLSRKSEKKITEGLNELLDSVESIGVILFISTSVYNVKAVREYLSFGYFFQSSYTPHLAMLFMSLRNGGKCMLSRDQIVTNKGFDTPAHLRWDQIFIYQLIILLRLPLSPVSQKSLDRDCAS